MHDIAPALAALRARGAAQRDPMRFHVIEALARRAAAHSGEVRQLLDAKLARLLAACAQQLDHAQPGAGAGSPPVPAPTPQRGPLAALIHQLDQQAAALGQDRTHGTTGAIGVSAADAGAPVELKALRHFRSTWSRLSIDQQLSRSLAKAPGNAGPLNSHLLLLRALTLMRDSAPGYLDRFMSYVDALLWLDQAGSTSAPAAGPLARGEADRKRGKSGRGKPA
jgi:hypothetical protein